MAKHIMLAGTTSRREYIFILDSSSTVGAGRTGLTNATAGWKVYYVRPGAAPVSITLGAAVAATTAYTSASFSEVDATNMPGIYRFDVPDAVFAAGQDKAIVMLSGPSNVAPVTLEYQLTAAGESWIASGVWNAQLTNYATAGSGETFGTDTYGTKLCRTTTPNRNVAVAGTQRVEANTATITAGAIANAAFATGAISSTTFANDAITSAVIATDAITSAELSSTANDEIAAAVWAATVRTITGGTVTTVGSGGITASTFAANALDAVWATTARTITGGTIGTVGSGAITTGSFTPGSVTSAVFGDDALVIQNTTPGTGVKIRFATDAITSSVIANDAITNAELASTAVQEIWEYNISAFSTAGQAGTYLKNAGGVGNPWLTDVSNATTYPAATTAGGHLRSAYTETNGLALSINALPYDTWTQVVTSDSASYGDLTSYTMVDVMALLAKGYCSVFGTVQASPAPTATTIKSSLTGYLNSAFNDQTIVFLAGSSIAGSCTVISSSTSSGNLVFDEPLHQQPSVGDEFMILPMHVHLRGAIADKLLGRSIAGAADGGRTVTDALRVLRNKTSISGNTLTVTTENDTATAWTATLTTNPTADPVTGIDPA